MQVKAIAEQRAEELKRKEPEAVMPKPILGPLPGGLAPAPSTSLPPPPGGPVSLPPPPRPAATPLPPPPVARPPPQQVRGRQYCLCLQGHGMCEVWYGKYSRTLNARTQSCHLQFIEIYMHAHMLEHLYYPSKGLCVCLLDRCYTCCSLLELLALVSRLPHAGDI